MDTVRTIVTSCREVGVEVLTLYAFSEENWKRPSSEIKALMSILKRFLVSERKLMKDQEVRLQTIGNVSKLPEDIQKTLRETQKRTEQNNKMTLVLALSYGGREEITRAVREIAQKAATQEVVPEEIDAEMISRHLDTAPYPDPDLLIRTSGEFRTSNFLPWQSIYTEFYVTETLWPDFSEKEFLTAISAYQNRERRFGLTSEQLKPQGSAKCPAVQ